MNDSLIPKSELTKMTFGSSGGCEVVVWLEGVLPPTRMSGKEAKDFYDQLRVEAEGKRAALGTTVDTTGT